MATAALLGYELAPRIKGLRHQTLYKIDRGLTYPYLDPILSGTVKVHLIRDSWDAVVRLVASLKTRIVAPSLMLQRLGSYARQNSMHQALAEIGRVEKTIHILRTLDSEDYRRRMGRELNKGESSHDLSRFLCFGKEGALRGREFEDQLHTFSCLALLHNAVVAWNTLQIGSIVEQLRREGENVEEADLALTSLFCDVISILSVDTTLTSNASVASLKLTRILRFRHQVTVPKNFLRWVFGRSSLVPGFGRTTCSRAHHLHPPLQENAVTGARTNAGVVIEISFRLRSRTIRVERTEVITIR